MSTLTFFAWSLIVAGALALLMAVIERRVSKREARITSKVGRTAAVLAILFYGALLTSDFAHFFLATQAPAWTRLLSSGVPLILGLFFLLNGKHREAESPMRVYTGILIVIGVVILAFDGYHYAISLGTATSTTLS